VALPLESALYLSGNDTLTLRQLLDGGLDLSALKIVVLSACQTGLTDFRTVPDEAIGFPAGFLEAGVPNAVGTLWSVEEISTALLLAKFYYFHLQEEVSLPTALHRAQRWLRQVTGAELADIFQRQYEESRKHDVDALRWIHYYRIQNDRKPYHHPYYWAAFYISGVGL
jgi:CHAT domain-containing protein